MEQEDETLNLGLCCSCEKSGPSVKNILMLNKKCPLLGKGWGCLVCNLPNDGAVAVVCDECMEASSGKAPMLIFACRGWPAEDGRIAFSELMGVHEHNMHFHQKDLQ